MDLGALEVQIFVSLTLVLGAVFVALVCDYLKGNNEVLHARNIELSVRQQERERHSAATVAARAPQEVDARPAPAEPRFEPHPVAKESRRLSTQPTWAKPEEINELDRLAQRIRSRVDQNADKPETKEEHPTAASVERLPASVEVDKEPAAMAQQPADPVEKPAPVFEESNAPAAALPPPPTPVVKAEAPASAPSISASARKPEPGPITPESELAAPKPPWNAKVTPINAMAADRTRTVDSASAAEAQRLAKELERVANLASTPAAPPPPKAPEPVAEPPAPPEKLPHEPVDLRNIFDPEKQEPRRVVAERVREPEPRREIPVAEAVPAKTPEVKVQNPPPPVVEKVQTSRATLPSGIVDRETFKKLLESEQTLQGTVIAIGVSGLDEAPWEQNGTADLLKGLLRAEDLACRTAENEFMMVLPEQTGAQAQQRIQHVSQQLWDHQIRSVGRSPVMFCWGATEAMDETLSIAVSSSRDRLEQTRRNRERAPRKIHSYRAVNS